MMPWRTAHGKARRIGRLTVCESTPADELPEASPVALEAQPPERDAKGRFLPGNRTSGLGPLGKYLPRKHGLLGRLQDLAPSDWRLIRKDGRKAAHHRIAEMTRLHGGELSSGVCALLLEGAEMRADSTYLRVLAAVDLEQAEATSYPVKPLSSKVDMLRLSIQLSAGARQSERDAWELASREARARRDVAQDSGPDLSAQIAEGVASPPTPALPAGDSTPVPPLAPPGGHCVEGPHPPKEPTE